MFDDITKIFFTVTIYWTQQGTSMVTFGSTWWGQEWLKSLTKIDYSNRLPRGRTYANNGSVRSITFDENLIEAKVKGSRSAPYSITIKVPLLRGGKKNLFMKVIDKNPLIVGQLMNRELPEELDDLAKENGIELFPQSWRDLTMKCSCPDSAVPCKHIAAVIYLVANEIDKNPFLLFKLHGLDILGESSGSSASSPEGIIPKLSDIKIIKGKDRLPQVCDVNELINLDFSKIEESGFLDVLKSKPLFYPKDFKGMLKERYELVKKSAEMFSENFIEEEVSDLAFSDSVRVNNLPDFSEMSYSIFSKGKETKFDADEFAEELLSLNDKSLSLYHASVVFSQRVILFALQCFRTGQYLPKIYSLGNDSFCIRYIPYYYSAAVREASDIIIKNSPELVEVKSVKGKISKQETISPKDFFECMFHSFAEFLVEKCHWDLPQSSLWQQNSGSEKIRVLFSGVSYVKFSGPGEREIPGSIAQWFSVLHLSARRFVPVIEITEKELPDKTAGFAISLFASDSTDPGLPPVPFRDILNKKEYESVRLEVIKDMQMIGEYFPVISCLIQAKGTRPEIVAIQDFGTIYAEILPLMDALGVRVLLPKSLSTLVRPAVSLMVSAQSKSGEKLESFLGLSSMLDYKWMVSVGGENINIKEFKQMLSGASGLVKIRDSYIYITPAELARLEKSLRAERPLSPVDLVRAAIGGEVNDVKAGLTKEAADLVHSLTAEKPIPLPKGLNAQLRPYQVRGYEWLAKNADLGMGCILADDMGLGKTLQVIALLLRLKEQGFLKNKKALVVAPTTLVSNWQHECERFAPGLDVAVYHGAQRKLDTKSCDVVLTSYGLARNDFSKLEKTEWRIVVIDEAQNIKNHTAEQSKAIKKIKGDFRVAMSGTPVENRMGEYWSIFDFANSGYLGSYKSFCETFSRPIHLNRDAQKIELFKKVTAPFIMRRIKTDKKIISDLPDKIENDRIITLSKEQAVLYQKVVDNALETIEKAQGISRKGLVFKLMIALKQIGNHPYQYLKSGKRDILLSGKAALLAEIISEIIEVNEKALIFTQFKEMGTLLADIIRKSTGEDALFLHGGLTRKQRDGMVDDFQNNPARRVFILSLKAGGTGLNLTAASHVIHYDLWWNPAVESQATDRAFRIGQTRNVMVHRLINKGTIEEKIDVMLREKKALANLTVASGENWIGNLSNDELKALVMMEG
jgi:superfamily II DNA or RNA helicase